LKWVSLTPTNRSGRGWDFYINDTTANNSKFRVYSDSTVLLAEIGADSIALYKKLIIHKPITVDSLIGTIHIDSLKASKGATLSGTVNVDSLHSTKGINFTNLSLSGVFSVDTLHSRGIVNSGNISAPRFITTGCYNAGELIQRQMVNDTLRSAGTGFISILGESGAADTMRSIETTLYNDNDIVILQNGQAGVISIKNGAGNIVCGGVVNLGITDIAVFILHSSQWYMISTHDN
jgi:hypothetical protein